MTLFLKQSHVARVADLDDRSSSGWALRTLDRLQRLADCRAVDMHVTKSLRSKIFCPSVILVDPQDQIEVRIEASLITAAAWSLANTARQHSNTGHGRSPRLQL